MPVTSERAAGPIVDGPRETAENLHAWFSFSSPIQLRPIEGHELRVIGVRHGHPALTLIEIQGGDDAAVAEFAEALFAELRSRGRQVATDREEIPDAIQRAIQKGRMHARLH